jgi:hypothetical protein
MTTKKTVPIEYRLLVQQTYDDVLQKAGILFLLETTKQFTNFSYHINVRDRFEGKDLHWTLHGLQAPSMNMPETGTAQFSAVYFDTPKTIHFTLTKNEKIRSSVKITLLKSSVRASHSEAGFLKVYTDKTEFDANRMNDTRSPEHKPDLLRPATAPSTIIRKKKT